MRIVHLGLGAFSRSHVAWYTHAAEDAAGWGIAAYTGSSAALPEALGGQDGVYTLIERDADGDHAHVIESVVRAHAGTDHAAWVADVAAPETAVVTLTMTEAAYGLTPDDPSRVADLAALAAGEPPTTGLGRLLAGLDGRRRAGSGPLALLSCDNLPENGQRLERALLDWAREISVDLTEWVRANVAFASSSVDRITPALSETEREELAQRYVDRAPVVAEPFCDWVISGDFPAGRPRWESAGARFVEDLEPWEARKLWLLNGAHTLLANLGPLRGHESVAEAICDPVCRRAVEALWDEAERILPEHLEIPAYRASLLRRFENPRIVHELRQIARDTPLKLGVRIAPVALRELADGRSAAACAAVFAAWLAAKGQGGVAVGDDGAECVGVVEAIAGVSPELAGHPAFVDEVRAARVERAVRAL